MTDIGKYSKINDTNYLYGGKDLALLVFEELALVLAKTKCAPESIRDAVAKIGLKPAVAKNKKHACRSVHFAVS